MFQLVRLIKHTIQQNSIDIYLYFKDVWYEFCCNSYIHMVCMRIWMFRISHYHYKYITVHVSCTLGVQQKHNYIELPVQQHFSLQEMSSCLLRQFNVTVPTETQSMCTCHILKLIPACNSLLDEVSSLSSLPVTFVIGLCSMLMKNISAFIDLTFYDFFSFFCFILPVDSRQWRSRGVNVLEKTQTTFFTRHCWWHLFSIFREKGVTQRDKGVRSVEVNLSKILSSWSGNCYLPLLKGL